jgi:hypothetical protein
MVSKLSGQKETRRLFIVISISLIAILRVFIVADRDIIATFSPYDEYWYVDAALRRIWGGHYHHMSFAHLPIYSFWLMFLRDFGIPARIAVDVFWLIGSGYLAFALFNFTKRLWIAITAFIILTYHPYSLILFDRALSENFLTVILTYVIAGFIEIWNLRLIKNAWRLRVAYVFTAMGYAIAYHTRKEGIILIIPIAICAIISLLKRKIWWSRTGCKKLGIPIVIMPILATIVLGVFLAGGNYIRWGVFARYELAAPQYARALKALLSIDPETPTPRHVSVSAETRKLAYKVSPTFSELQPYFESAIGKNLERMTTEMDPEVSGEIGDWVFYWAIRDAAASAGWHVNAQHAEDKYAAVANELDTAFSTGKLPHRVSLISFVDPDWKKWVVFFPQSFFAELKLIVSPSVSKANLGQPAENATSKQFSDYCLLLSRRKISQNAEMIGWVRAPTGSWVGFGDENGAFSWNILGESERLDVPGARAFSLVSASREPPTMFFVRINNEGIGHIALDGLAAGYVRSLEGMDGISVGVEHLYIPPDRWIVQRIERLSRLVEPFSTQTIPTMLANMWGAMGYILLICTLIVVCIGLFTRTELDALVVIGLVTSVVIGRAGVFGLLDASSWYAQASRYMFPAVPFFIAGISVGIFVICSIIQKRAM